MLSSLKIECVEAVPNEKSLKFILGKSFPLLFLTALILTGCTPKQSDNPVDNKTGILENRISRLEQQIENCSRTNEILQSEFQKQEADLETLKVSVEADDKQIVQLSNCLQDQTYTFTLLKYDVDKLKTNVTQPAATKSFWEKWHTGSTNLNNAMGDTGGVISNANRLISNGVTVGQSHRR